jgi:hypothetical protein
LSTTPTLTATPTTSRTSTTTSSVTPSISFSQNPITLIATAENKNSLILSWIDHGTRSVSGYTISYRIINNSTGGRKINTATNNYIINNLNPLATYSIQISGTDQYGIKFYSNTVTIPLTISAPNSPTNLSVISANQSLILSWDTPSNNGGSDIIGYTIKYYYSDFSYKSITIPAINSYTITDLNNETTYSISISAQNNLYTGISAFIIGTPTTTSSVPSMPTNLTSSIRAASIAILDLSWTAPSGPVVEYIIEYTMNQGVPQTIHTGNNTNTYTLAGLVYNTNYSIRVAAVNGIGIGSYSTAIQAMPAPAVPDQVPNLYVSTGLRGKLFLYWSIPQNNGSSIIGYKIQYYSTNNNNIITININNTHNDYTIDELDPNVEYSIRVAAVNSIGTGSYTSYMTGIPTSGYLPDPPSDLSITCPKHSCLTLSWNTPWNGLSDIINYQIEYSSAFQPAQTIKTNNLSTNFTLSGLQNNVIYKVRIAAINGAGLGLYSNFVLGTPVTSTPSAPLKLNITSYANKLELFWTNPEDNGGLNITGYVIQYNNINIDILNLNTYIINNLNPDTDYNIKIAAKNNNGIGSYTSAITVKTKVIDIDLTVPKNVLAENNHNYGIKLSWINPKYADPSVITGVSIKYYETSKGENTAIIENYTNISIITISDDYSEVVSSVYNTRTILSYINLLLKKNTDYTFRVSTMTKYDSSPYSDPVTGSYTLEATPKAPINFSVVPRDMSYSNSLWLDIYWTEPEENNSYNMNYDPYRIIYYRVSTQTLGPNGKTINNDYSTDPLDYRDKSVLLGYRRDDNRHLMYRDTLYSQIQPYEILNYPAIVRVAAANSYGLGEFAEAIIYDKPKSPTNIKTYFDITNNIINLFWNSSSTKDIPIVNYSIKYTIGGSENIINTNSDSCDYKLRGLTSQQMISCSIQIASIDAVGRISSYTSPVAYSAEYVCSIPQPPSLSRSPVPGSLSALISWTPPSFDGGSKINRYVILVLIGTSVITTTYVDGTATDYLITGLQNNTSYNIKIAAQNDIGNSDYLTTKLSSMSAFTPTEPLNFSSYISSRTKTCVLSWTNLSISNNNTIIGYIIRYKLYNNDYKYIFISSDNGDPPDSLYVAQWAYYANSKWNYNSIRVEQIMSTSAYMSIAAIDSTGFMGPFTTDIDINNSWIYEMPSPRFAPDNFKVKSDNQSLQLSWTPYYEFHNKIKGYRIEYAEEGNSFTTINIYDSYTSTYTLNNLTNNINYIIKIAAINNCTVAGTYGKYECPGPEATITAMPISSPIVPSVPLKPSVGGLGINSFVIDWEVPYWDGNSTITGYNIEYTPENGNTQIVFFNASSVTPENFSFCCNDGKLLCIFDGSKGLVVGLGATFRIAAVNSIGVGLYTDPITVSNSPGPILDLSVSTHTSTPPFFPTNFTSVDLRWSTPKDGGSAFEKVYIYYRQTDNHPGGDVGPVSFLDDRSGPLVDTSSMDDSGRVPMGASCGYTLEGEANQNNFFIPPGLKIGVEYEFRIKLVNKDDQSNLSNRVKFVPGSDL